MRTKSSVFLMNSLRRFRTALGLSRNELALEAGVSPQTIEKYEAELPAPLAQKFASIAAARGKAELGNQLLSTLNPAGADASRADSPATPACPRCESTLSVSPGGLTKVMEPGPVPSPETCNVSHKSGVLSEEREWWNLVASAVHVQDPDWRGILEGVKAQLEQVAAVAEREASRAKDSGLRRGDSGRTAEFGSGGSGSVDATRSRRKKAG